MILYGQYIATIDATGGWSVPAVFARALAEGGVVTAGLDGCLWVYPTSNWQAFVERVSPRLQLTHATAREFARHVFGQAHPLTLNDSSPRLNLSEPLRQLAAIGDRMVWVGVVDHIELWTPERWQAQLARADSTWTADLSALGV